MNKFVYRIHHTKLVQMAYSYVPVFKCLVDLIYGIFVGRSDLMVNRVYWYLYKITNYSRPDYILFKGLYINHLSLPNETNVLSINPNRIKYQIVSTPDETRPIEYGSWDLNKIKLENTHSNLKTSNPTEEIRVVIDRNGSFLLNDGIQHLLREKKAGSKSIKVTVMRRHYEWAKLKKEIYSYSQEQPKGVYQIPVHPDLRQINAHRRDDRWELIAKNIPINKGSVLDIGSNWGYFCHKFEDLGFDCSAVEINYRWLYFLRKLRDAENKNFKVIQGSVFKVPQKEYDIVLALSIFHHFLRSAALYEELTNYLNGLDIQYMFFEPHETGHGFPGAYIDYSETEFIDYILHNSCLNEYKLLGKTQRGRRLYLLSAT